MKEQQQAQSTKVAVKFAGQKFEVEKQLNKNELAKLKQQQKKQLGGQQSGLDVLVNMIDNQDKNINAYQKTKLDWDKFTKDNKFEAEFDKNRKDGFIQKQVFLSKVADIEYKH